jgi:hypothetical protein
MGRPHWGADRNRQRMLVVGIATLAGGVGASCFRGADVAAIVCDQDRYCPSGYHCLIPAGQSQGSCQRVGDAGPLEAMLMLDGSMGMEASLPVDFATVSDREAVDRSPIDSPSDLAVPVDANVDMVPGEVGADVLVQSGDSLDAADVRIGADVLFQSGDSLDAADASQDVPMGTDPPADAARKSAGASCAAGGECASTYCVDGVCCATACTGQCQACAEQSAAGSCVTVTGAPRGTRPPCGAAQPACAGHCGSLADKCTYPGSDLVCSAAACTSDTVLRPASVCDGAGACTVASAAPCGAGKYCAGGACMPQAANGSSCQSASQCTSGNCSNGLCCASGMTACAGGCVSLSSSNANCGSCGRSCATGSSCSGGSCYLADGQACTTGSQCLSGVCSTFYLDGDGDGYGAGTGVMQCGTVVPGGYANKAGDCCDGDSNAHPGQASYFTSADTCGSFDYNCDGTEKPKSNGPAPDTCGTPNCQVVGEDCVDNGGCLCNGSCLTYSTAGCGQSYTYRTALCAWAGATCGTISSGNVAGTQACN